MLREMCTQQSWDRAHTHSRSTARIFDAFPCYLLSFAIFSQLACFRRWLWCNNSEYNCIWKSPFYLIPFIGHLVTEIDFSKTSFFFLQRTETFHFEMESFFRWHQPIYPHFFQLMHLTKNLIAILLGWSFFYRNQSFGLDKNADRCQIQMSNLHQVFKLGKINE